MKLLETKEKLTLIELLRIAYEYGNDNAIRPEDDYKVVNEEFAEWVNEKEELLGKLVTVQPAVLNEIITHIEETDQRIEHEFGDCRNLQEVIDAKDMPAIYYKLIALKNE